MEESVKSRKPRRLENTTRRTLEWVFLALTLIVGLGVVGACGGLGLATASGNDGILIVSGLLGGTIVVVGLVYLATSMSRDVRLLKQALLEKERDGRGE